MSFIVPKREVKEEALSLSRKRAAPPCGVSVLQAEGARAPSEAARRGVVMASWERACARRHAMLHTPEDPGDSPRLSLALINSQNDLRVMEVQLSVGLT
jgi:hypothetical protein